jgi:transcription elongation factor Elf1
MDSVFFFSFLVSDLSDPIDVYSEWVDQTESINKKVAQGDREEQEEADEASEAGSE